MPRPTLDEIYGSTSTTVTSKRPSLDEIYGGTPQTPMISANGVPEATPQSEKGFFASIVDPLSKFGGSVLKTLLPASMENLPTGPKLSEGRVSGLTGNTIDVAGFKQGQELTGSAYAKDVVGTTAQALSYLPMAGVVGGVGKALAARAIPALASTALEGGIGTGLAFGGQALQEQKTLAESGVEAAKGFGIGAVAAPVIGAGIGALGVGARKLFTTKTAEEIMSTPIEKLGKLSSTERSYYFSQKAQDITKKYQDEIANLSIKNKEELNAINKAYLETTSKIDAEQAVKVSAVKSNAEKLNQELADASVAEVEKLKPKLIETMRKSSDTYRQLVDDEIGQVADVQVTNNEIAASIRNKFSEDPAKAEQIINILKSKTDGPQTVQSVYENTKMLRKEIGTGARQGSRTLTSEEYNTTEAISALLDFLKTEKGVDLSKANKFWAEYAPIKNKLYRYIQPYKPVGTETASFKTFAKILASNDPYNQNFIKETEKLLGVSFKDSKARDILSKIDANKKAQIAAKLETATQKKAAQIKKLEDSIVAREKLTATKQSVKEMKALEEQKQELIKLNATLQAERRTLLKRIIGGFLILGLGKTATDTLLGGI